MFQGVFFFLSVGVERERERDRGREVSRHLLEGIRFRCFLF